MGGRTPQVIDGYLIDDNFYTIRFKRCIHIPNIIIQRHTKVHAAAAAPGHIYP